MDLLDESLLEKQILTMNFSLKNTIKQLSKFKEIFNVIDHTLEKNLDTLADLIEEFIDGSPKVVKPKITMDENEYKKFIHLESYRCLCCKTGPFMKFASKFLYTHVTSAEHIRYGKQYTSEENSEKKLENNGVRSSDIKTMRRDSPARMSRPNKREEIRENTRDDQLNFRKSSPRRNENRDMRRISPLMKKTPMIPRNTRIPSPPRNPRVQANPHHSIDRRIDRRISPIRNQVKPPAIQELNPLMPRERDNNTREISIPQGSRHNDLVPTLRQDYRNITSMDDVIELEQPIFERIDLDLSEMLRGCFPRFKPRFYGSRKIGAPWDRSNYNIYIDTGDNSDRFGSSEEVALEKLVMVVKQTRRPQWSNTWVSSGQNRNSRILTLELNHLPMRLRCNLTFTNGIFFEHQTKLMLYFFQNPVWRKICILIKNFHTLLQEQVSMYIIVLLMMFYQQSKNSFPPISGLQRIDSEIEPVEFGPWQVNFERRPLSEFNIRVATDTFANFLRNLKGFFEFYSTFNFKQLVICPYLGQSFDRQTHLDEVMETMPRYHLFCTTERGQLNIDSPICIQDPFEQNVNITSELPPKFLYDFQKLCEMASTDLDSTMSNYI